ncbi:MAG TPA: SUMF1/EgtB/PvdO family nonheme iron enzyme [Opitutales bacterium]|nr:SUMF1/EgtB/PvdO family nonheme iron enzyme [Opitutales bacterium]
MKAKSLLFWSALALLASGNSLRALVFDVSDTSGFAILDHENAGMDFCSIGASGNSGNAVGGNSSRVWGSVNYEYCIGATEVTCAQYAVFLNATGYSSYMFDSSSAPYIGLYKNADGSVGVRAGCADKAVSVVRYAEAVAFANWLGTGDVNTAGAFRLPDVNEWYKAAYYDPTLNGGAGGYWTYGTGSDTLTEEDAFYGYLSIGTNSESWPDADYGEENQWGLYGMTAGLEEWTGTAQNTAGSRHWVLGGSWAQTEPYLTNSRLNNLANTSANDKLGFRIVTELDMSSVVAVPEPSTAALSIGALVLAYAVCRKKKAR